MYIYLFRQMTLIKFLAITNNFSNFFYLIKKNL